MNIHQGVRENFPRILMFLLDNCLLTTLPFYVSDNLSVLCLQLCVPPAKMLQVVENVQMLEMYWSSLLTRAKKMNYYISTVTVLLN